MGGAEAGRRGKKGRTEEEVGAEIEVKIELKESPDSFYTVFSLTQHRANIKCSECFCNIS